MADHLLSAIIDLEKELQAQVQAELARATAWRERQLAELIREDRRQRAALAAARTAQVETARREATTAGEQTLAAVRAWCARLESLSDEVCSASLRPLLQRLLPEAGDDYPHGQG